MAKTATNGLNSAFDRAMAHAPFLRMLAQRFPDCAEAILCGSMDDSTPHIDPNFPLAKALRQARSRQALTLAIGDLGGVISLEELMGHLSRFADAALDCAVAHAIETLTPGADPVGFAIIALGKHGSFELNYSSDIDPIFLYDPVTLPRRERDDPAEAAVRIGKHVLDLLHSRDGDGHVFRVDLRLRPSPEVTPIALPINAAISYYESQALPWERAAFIRARACAGDITLGQRFLDAIQPFVWRRALDFGAVREIRDITQRIRNHYAQGQKFGPGFDLKRGRGGIREIEFFAQIHQLIFGGRDENVRAGPTMDALAALARAERVEAAAADDLTAAYRLFRQTEHRLQMIDDRQTHTIPESEDALDVVARLDGRNDGQALLDALRPHVAQVASHYDGLDTDPSRQLTEEAKSLADYLQSQGFSDGDHAARLVTLWRSGTLRCVRTPEARAALESVLPVIVEGLGKAPDPQYALNQFSLIIERLPSAINLFRLLEAQPKMLALLIRILGLAPALAAQLSTRATLLDTLIDACAFEPVPDVSALTRQFAFSGPLEAQLDHVRREVGERRFGLGVQLIEGLSDPMAAAQSYASIAEAAIQAVATAVLAEFAAAHGQVPGSALIILALGRLGGAELTHESDLDLVFLFTGDFERKSDGRAPLGATLYYNRLVQRIIAGLSVQTAEGPLYKVDTRLRPSGAKGPLVVSLESFARYHEQESWTWELMALTRARPVFGSPKAREAVSQAIESVMKLDRDPKSIRRDATEMRAEIAANKPPSGPLDVKLSNGGLVDLEFGLQVIQLIEQLDQCPSLGARIAQLAALQRVDKGLIEAHRLLTSLLVIRRLVVPAHEEPEPSQKALMARASGYDSWEDLLLAYEKSRHLVADFWQGQAEKRKED